MSGSTAGGDHSNGHRTRGSTPLASPVDGITKTVLRQQTFIALSLFLVLTIAVGWPVLSRLDEVLAGSDYDVFINPWADWWTAKALSDPSLSLWQTDYLFYPVGVSLVFHSFSHLNTGVSLLLRPFFGSFPAYNLTILLNYVLLGVSMFHFARYLTGSFTASLLAGVIFAFNSHSLYQSAHPVLLSIWPLPWGALFLLRAVRENSRRYALIASLLVFLAAFASTIILILMGFWLGLILLYLLIAGELTRRAWPLLFIFGLTSITLCLPLLAPLLVASIGQENGSFIIDPETSINADVLGILIPRWYFPETRDLYLGLLPLSLLVMARHQRQARPWYLLFLAAYLFSIGPLPRVGSIRLDVTLPWSLILAPLLRNMYRMNILLSLALAMLAAIGWWAMTRNLGAMSRRLLIVPFLVLILIDYSWPGFPYMTVNVSDFYTEYLDEILDEAALAVLPLGRGEGKRAMLRQTFHGQRITGGVVSRSAPETLRFIQENELLRAAVVDWDPVPIPQDPRPAIRELADAGVGYIVLEKGRGLEIEKWRSIMPLQPVFEDELVLVYETHFE